MFGAITAYLHEWLDYGLALCKMVKNRDVGWVTIDRKTGEHKREQQPLLKKIKLLLLFNPVFEWIDTTRWFRHYLHEKADIKGRKMSTAASAQKIKAFVDFYGINMNDFTPSDITEYETFQDFFTRLHTPESRPIHAPEDPTAAIAPADCRTVVYPSVPQARKIWIKGHHFSIENLVQDERAGRMWDAGSIASLRLSPQDYHRYHCPVDGTVLWWKAIKGDYYSVDPIAIRSDINILTSNARCAVCIDSKEFGMVLFVAIGASEVGTVKFHESFRTPGHQAKKGQEIGMFEFGGSSIVVCFEKGRMAFDHDLLQASERAEEVCVEMGMSLGRAAQEKERLV